MIAQRFDFTMGFSKAQYSDSYTQLRKTHCGIKDQARAHVIGGMSGLGKNRGSALTSADRGLTLARRRHGRGLWVADLAEAIRLEKLAKGIRYVGNKMVAIDAGSRIYGVTQTYRNGGDWMREASVEMTGFGAGGAAGMVVGKATVSGAALGAAALGLAITPVGWCIIIGVGVAAGFGAGYALDHAGKSLASGILNR